MNDLISMYGYNSSSPFRNNPYLDIKTSTGEISMEDTPIDLLGIDNLGNTKYMKARRKNPYRFKGNVVREIPMQQGGFQSYDDINKANQFARDFLARQNAPSYFVNNAVVARNIGDPLPKFVYTSGSTPSNTNLASTLPFGVSANDIELTTEGYGYYHPQEGTFVKVNPEAIYNRYGKKEKDIQKQAEAQIIASNPYRSNQYGGLSKSQILDFLFEDDYKKNDEEENIPTAPSEKQVRTVTNLRRSGVRESQYNLAMQQIDDSATENASEYTPPPTYMGRTGNDKAKYAYEFFQQKGLPPHVSAGIVGNLIQESGRFRDDVISGEVMGDDNQSFGIAQWHRSKKNPKNDRITPFFDWAKSTGRNPYTLDAQLEYVYHEAAQRGDLQYTMKAKDAEEAAYRFAQKYERPAIVDKKRIKYAKELYPHYKGGLIDKYFKI